MDRKVIVDSRETPHHLTWFDDSEMARELPGTFLHEGMVWTQEALEFGDFKIQLQGLPLNRIPWLLVESKTWPDLLASLRDNGNARQDSRIRHQLEGLLKLHGFGYHVAVMTVGILTPAGGKNRGRGVYIQNKGKRQFKNWSYFELMGALTAIQHLGIMTLQAPSEAEVPHTLRIAAEVCERQEHFQSPGLPRLAALSPRLGALASTFTAVEGVGRQTALDLAMHFKTFPGFYEATEKELEKVQGVGKIMAQRLYAHFHGLEEAKLVPIRDIVDYPGSA